MYIQLFIPVEPSTSYETILTRSLSILGKSSAVPPEDSGFSSFDVIEAEDAALFTGSSTTVGGVLQDKMRFTELDREKQSTVSKMGFKDGSDAVAYLGFRNKGKSEYCHFLLDKRSRLTVLLLLLISKGKYSDPVVKIPLLVEDEEDEEDPDAIPPPLGDDDEMMGEPIKGKSRA